MKYTYKHNSWFTLIELLVSITIFSIIMVSVITIFIFSSNLAAKVDINRAMQENIKNAVETIAEDVRQNGIVGLSLWASIDCRFPLSSESSISSNRLCTWSSDYVLKKDSWVPDGAWSTIWTRALAWDCLALDSHCVIYKDNSPLTNSFVSFREFGFTLTWDDDTVRDIHDGKTNKVTINFIMQPAVRKWVRSDLIENSKIIFQTTVSERLIQSN